MSQFFSNEEPISIPNKHTFSVPKTCVENEKLIRLAKLARSNDRERGPFRNLRF